MMLIPEIRELIIKYCPIPAAAAQDAVARWENGLEPKSPTQRAVFAMCDKVREDMAAADKK